MMHELSPSPALGSTMDFQLQRLILIDSYSTGRVVVFPLAGGAVLTGRNGRGKTSLLQLLPVFFGENPNRIVGTETNRLNFVGYYLPRLTSYILFEYRRRDVTCLMVMHCSESGEEIRYRFVRSAYKPELFLNQDGRSILSSRDIYAQLKRLNITCTEVISSVAEYRSIIQGKVGAGRDRQRQRNLAADYAFVGSDHHLTHMEKIVSGMFLRKTNFEDLQRMVVSCIADGPAQISLATERKKIESWPEHFDAYRAVMQETARMDEILAAEKRLVASEVELGCIHGRLRHLQEHLAARENENCQQRDSLNKNTELADENYRRHAESLAREKEAARHEATDRQQRLTTLLEQEKDYAQNNLPAKAERVAMGSRLRSEWDETKQRKQTLLGKQENISLSYDRMLAEQQEQFNEARAQALSERSRLQQTFAPRYLALEQAKDQDLISLREAHQQEWEKSNLQLQARLGEEGSWKARLASPQASAESQAAHQSKSEALAEANQALEAARLEQGRREKLAATARQAFEEQEKQLQALRAQRVKQAEQLETLRRRQTPGPDSLLYFLRSQRPDWVFDIAKVVREDILMREDLAPGLLETLPSLYGISLDLEPLDAHLAADEQALQREATTLAERVKTSDANIVTAQAQLEKLNRLREEARQALAAQETTVQGLSRRRQSAQEEEKAARQQMDKSRREAESLARETLVKLAQGIKHLRDSLSALEQDRRKNEDERTQRYQQARSELDAEQNRILSEHDQIQQARKTAFDQRRDEMRQEKDQALKNAGVDTAALGRLEAEISRLTQQLQQAQEWREIVAQWQLWLEQEWPRREVLAREAAAAREKEIARQADLTKLQEEQNAARKKTQLELARLDKDLKRLQQEQNTIRQRLGLLAAYPPDTEVLSLAYDPAWTLELLAHQANERQREATRELEAIRKHIAEIKRAFVLRRDTPPEQFYDTHRQELGPDASDRDWIVPFKSWFSSEHDLYRRTLQVEANQIASAIVSFHRDMESFHRKVQQFSRELQQSLDDNIAFESISRVSIEIVSVIRQLEYWQAIDGMAEEHRVWLGQDTSELPPPEFAATLRNLLSHWEVREGIRAELSNLIRIQGEVVENNQTRIFRKAADLERVSSNGLSYLILCVIFIAFINRIRRHAKVQIVWALDELKDLDIGNIEALLLTLKRNDITLVSAFPDPDADVLRLFPHRFSIEEGRRLVEVQVMEGTISEEDSHHV